MNRRSLLKTASWGALAQLTGVSPLRSIAALAQNSSSSDYKALICLFLRGGNDSNSMIVPLSGLAYSQYSQSRASAAVSQGQLLPLLNAGYGLHPSFAGLQSLFATRNAAFIPNVGPLVQPTTVDQYRSRSVALPAQLMSHDDQQQAWELGGYSSGVGSSWAGVADDILSPTYNVPNLPMVTLLGNASTFGRSKSATPFTAAGNAQSAAFWCSQGLSCYPRAAAAQQLLTFNNGVSLLQTDQQAYQNAYKYNSFYNSVIKDAGGFRTAFPSGNPLSGALYTIATMIQLRKEIGAQRQIFLIDAGGFDTHANQAAAMPGLYTMLDGAISIFSQAMQELGVYNQVTLFTASDFSRTLAMNTAGGSDHAWGGHHFVTGGAVKGGALYGAFPQLQINGPDDIDGSGRFIPSTALSQYLATLASWFGVPASALPGMFPGLNNFQTANLGFV